MSLAKKVLHASFAGGDIYLLPSGHQGIVRVQGSIVGGEKQARSPVLVDWLTRMFDQGTATLDRETLNQQLEDEGIQIDFDYDAMRTRFSGVCLRQSWQKMLTLLAMQLQDSQFQGEHFQTMKKRYIGEMQERLMDTQLMAKHHMLNTLYPASHGNYEPLLEDLLKEAEALDLDDLQKHYQQVRGQGRMLVVIVGDVSPDMAADWQSQFADWQMGDISVTPPQQPAHAPEAKRLFVSVPGKVSQDVIMAQPLLLKRQDADYWPMVLAIDALGGNFAARLMRTVRDEDGLTYGIYSRLSGMEDEADGYLAIYANYSPENVAAGLAATLAQCRLWLVDLTEEELAARKEGMVGRFLLSLSTTTGLASHVLYYLEQGEGVAALDAFAERLQAVTLTHVQAAMAKHIDLDALLVVSAGG